MAFPDFEVVDLTHPLTATMPVYPGDKPFKMTADKAAAKQGITQFNVALGDHLGTHVDAPVHFIENGQTVDRIPANRLVLPGVMIDVREKTLDNPEYRFTVGDFFDWEEEYGWIPPYCAVLLHTGWGFKWHKPDAYLGTDDYGTMHFPGYGADVAEFLCEERSVLAMGIDTASIDVGRSSQLPVHRAMLGQDVVLVENLANLHKLPDNGFVVTIGALRLKGGSGSPARVFGLIPKS